MSSGAHKATRLVAMLQLLERDWHSPRRLAEMFRVTPRTIQRDIRDLESWPVYAPIVRDNHANYRIVK